MTKSNSTLFTAGSKDSGSEPPFKERLQCFEIEAKLASITPLKQGHIHETYIGEWQFQGGAIKRYIHQKINNKIFKNLSALEYNVSHVVQAARNTNTELIMQSKLEVIPLKGSNSTLLQTDNGEVWRTLSYIEDTKSFNVCANQVVAKEAGKAVGIFCKLLAALPASDFEDTIPNFLNARYRYQQLDEAVAKDAANRKKQIENVLAEAYALQADTTAISDALQTGEIPTRISHNDTKLNNILFHYKTGAAACVIDLDTCMQGTPLYDYGDLLRNIAVNCAEDERDLTRVELHEDNLRSVTSAFLNETNDLLTPQEMRLLPKAPGILAATLGVRFLSDYLNGDVYFRINEPQHNLYRARAQFAIARRFLEWEKSEKAIFRVS